MVVQETKIWSFLQVFENPFRIQHVIFLGGNLKYCIQTGGKQNDRSTGYDIE